MDRRHKSNVFLRYEKELKKTKFYFVVSIKVATLTSTTESTTTASRKCIYSVWAFWACASLRRNSSNTAAVNISLIRDFKTGLEQSAVRERYTKLLSSKLQRKLNAEQRASGIDPDEFEVDSTVEELTRIEDDSNKMHRLNNKIIKKNTDEENEMLMAFAWSNRKIKWN